MNIELGRVQVGKKELIIQAEKYLTTDLLYGTISNGSKNGILVKDMLEANADRIVKDGWDVENIAVNIRTALFDKETQEPIFTYAHDVPKLPLEPVIATPESKKEYVESFIATLPYKGTIRTGIEETDTLNIEEGIRSYTNLLNDDNTISYINKNITLKQLYKKLLDQEFTPPMLVDKIEAIMGVVNYLRSEYSNFEELAQRKINGKSFYDLIKELPSKMLDNLDVRDRLEVISLDQYLQDEFKRISEYTYNSVDSKPSNVELIGVEYNKEHKLTVTNEYIFLSPSEEESLKAEFSPISYEDGREDLHRAIITTIKGINEAKNLSTLALYEEHITKIISVIKEQYSNDQLLKELYSSLLEAYDKAYNSLSFVSQNDDIGYMVAQDLKDAKVDLKDYNRDFSRTLEEDTEQKHNIMYQFDSIKHNAYDMGVQGLHHELDEVDDEMKRLNAIGYGLNNVNHDELRIKNEMESLKINIDKEQRALEHANDPKAKATHQIALDKYTKDYNRISNIAIERGIISEEAERKIT